MKICRLGIEFGNCTKMNGRKDKISVLILFPLAVQVVS